MRRFRFSFIITVLLVFIQNTSAQPKFFTPQNPPKAHYTIEAKIDLQKKLVEGTERVSFSNTTKMPLTIIAIDWAQARFSTISVNVNGEQLAPVIPGEGEIISPPLLYALPAPLQIGEKIQLDIQFSAGNLIGSNLDEIKLVEWFPRLWWDGLPHFDSFEVKLDAPAGYAIAVSGRFNKKTGYYENEGVSRFGIYLGKGLKTETHKVGDILITSLFTEAGSQCAKLCLETAADVVQFYHEWLGFYPFKFLSIIPGGSEPWGGYPFASGIVVIHGQEKFDTKPLLHWKWITAHEIGHQYWGEFVLDNDVPSWLWIGMGIYADREYAIFRKLGLDKHIGLMNTYLDGVREHYDTTVEIPPEQFKKIKFDHNNIVKHGKGFSIISALESVLGKELFQKVYKRCLKEYGGRILYYREFWRLCEEVSGQDLAWFFEEWVRSNNYLCYRVTNKDVAEKDGHFISKIRIESAGTMNMPVPLKAVFEDGSSQVKFANRLFTENTLVFESQSKLKEVMLDPEHKFAMLDSPLSLNAGELDDLISQLPWSGAGEQALKAFQKAEEMKLDNASHWFKLALILFDGGYYAQSFESFNKFTSFNQTGLRQFTALVWMGHLKDLMGQRAEALTYYKKALEADTGQTMRHDQWGLQINRQWVEERLKTPFTWGK